MSNGIRKRDMWLVVAFLAGAVTLWLVHCLP
jgi:hypothetical protein